MGIFSKTPRSSETEDDAQRPSTGEARASVSAQEDDETPSNVERLSPFALRMQEKMHQIDGLKSRLGGLTQSFEQITAMASESRNSIQLLSEFIETSRAQVETEIRLKSENAKISTDLLDANHRVGTLTTQLGDAQAEVHSLRKRLTETRTALETARNELISIRDNNKKVNEDYRLQSARLVEANGQVAELTGERDDLQAKYASLEEHADKLQANLDEVTKREKELQQNLSESAALLEEEAKKNSQATSELESLRRRITDMRDENIDLKSHLDVANQELAYSKTRLEDEQRKHDNEVYTLNAEIENLSSQRRIGAQTLQDMTRDNAALKERNRELMKSMQEIERMLEGAQKKQGADREELVTANGKLRELNLRYNAALTDLNHERNQNARYAERLEDLTEENKRLQRYKIEVETANDQIVQLKSVIANYQRAMEGRGPAEAMGLTDTADPAEEAGLISRTRRAYGDEAEGQSGDGSETGDAGAKGRTPADKIVRLRDE